MNTVEFRFRVWIPAHDDVPTFKIWFHGLITPGKYMIEWVTQSFENEDFWKLFCLDPDKYSQIVGTAQLTEKRTCEGEYDEECNILEFQKLEMSESDFFNAYEAQ